MLPTLPLTPGGDSLVFVDRDSIEQNRLLETVYRLGPLQRSPASTNQPVKSDQDAMCVSEDEIEDITRDELGKDAENYAGDHVWTWGADDSCLMDDSDESEDDPHADTPSPGPVGNQRNGPHQGLGIYNTAARTHVFSQSDLGLPRAGLSMPKKSHKTTLKCQMTGRELTLFRYTTAEAKEDRSKTHSMPVLKNAQGVTILTPEMAARTYNELRSLFKEGDVKEIEVSPETLGSRQRKAWRFVFPTSLRLDPILSDSGSNASRGKQIGQLTVVAALYLAGWLDHSFSFSYQAAPSEPVTISMHRVNKHQEPVQVESDSDKDFEIIEGPTQRTPSHNVTPNPQQSTSGPSNSHHLIDQPSNKSVLPTSTNVAQSDKRNPTPQPQHSARATAPAPAQGGRAMMAGETDYYAATPKFWGASLPLSSGSFCATICRIKGPASDFDKRKYRTICILTKHRFTFPMGRPLPTCKELVETTTTLKSGQNLFLTETRFQQAHEYTLRLFSTARGKSLNAPLGEMPYLLLPMTSTWQYSDEAASEIEANGAIDVANNVAWDEVVATLEHSLRTPSSLETSGQGLTGLAEDSLYSLPGNRIFEVLRTCRDDSARQQAQNRVVSDSFKFRYRSKISPCLLTGQDETRRKDPRDRVGSCLYASTDAQLLESVGAQEDGTFRVYVAIEETPLLQQR